MKKNILSILAILLIIVLLTPPAKAIIDYPNPSDAAQSGIQAIMSLFGFDQDAVTNAAKTFNVAGQKNQQPQVSLTFTPSNPALGQKISAIAQPVYFMNDSKDLYFTWYLKHDGGNKDHNKDGHIDIEDYKIEAARIIASNDFSWDKADYSTSSDDDGYDAVFGGDDQRGKSEHCFYHDVESGHEFEIECEHLFPSDNIDGESLGDGSFGRAEEKFWHTDPNNSDTAGTGNTDESNVIGLGINQFTWNYTPGDRVGVAVEGISTTPAQTNDSSYKTMWALLKNKCSAFDDDVDDALDDFSNTVGTESGTTTTTSTTTTDTNIPDLTPDPGNTDIQETVVETTTTTVTDVLAFTQTVTTVTETTITVYDGADVAKEGTPISGPTTTTTTTIEDNSFSTSEDLNDCLTENFIDPVEGGTTNKIEVSLNAIPTEPINDKTGENSDQLIVHASTANVDNANYLKYAWEVFEADSPNPESWGDPLIKSDLPEVKQTSGIGLSTFKMKMAMESPKKYLKVKVTVTETTASNTTREGHNDIIVPVSSTNKSIHVYSALAKDNLTLEPILNMERCKSGMEKLICPVFKNEIVSISVPGLFSNILWTLDNKPLGPIDSDCSSNECDSHTGEAKNTTYFPILKGNGERYLLNFSATNDDGEKINLSKTFEVVDPNIKIISDFQFTNSDPKALCTEAYNTCPMLLGYYIDLDDIHWPDYSATSFESVVGKPISFRPTLVLPEPPTNQWHIDDVPIFKGIENIFGATIDENNVLTFTPAKIAGQTYLVSYTSVYVQSRNIKKILNKSFNVQLDKFSDKKLSASAEITMVDSLDKSLSAQKPTPKKILATLVADVPDYFNFLFRIILTVGLFLFISRILLAQFPKTN